MPPIVRKAIELLDEKAVKTEGLFRISGSKARILEVSKSSVCVKNESLMLCVGGLVARSMFLVGNVCLVLLGTGGEEKVVALKTFLCFPFTNVRLVVCTTEFPICGPLRFRFAATYCICTHAHTRTHWCCDVSRIHMSNL